MKKKEEFYVGYIGSMGRHTRGRMRLFVALSFLLLLIAGLIFSIYQKPAAHSRFDFDSTTQLEGFYFEDPYPLLRVDLGEEQYKDIVLLGFGKSGALPYLKRLREAKSLQGKRMRIEGNLVYYNGKSLLQITDENQVELVGGKSTASRPIQEGAVLKSMTGEIIDPKCYFGVMKPGFGKIHRSCAALCISGGIPPVWVDYQENGDENYYLITDLKGNPIHGDLIPYIGQISSVEARISHKGSWSYLALDPSKIQSFHEESRYYENEQ